MNNRKVRIGIDVGGTFTDAIIIDNQTGELIAKEKTPTTHYSEDGVAGGIIYLITKLMEENQILPSDVVFIAHGTTQATNALLEGDVASVGLIGVGTGKISQKEVSIKDIELAPNKYLKIENEFINEKDFSEEKVRQSIKLLKQKGVDVICASQAYSVDDNSLEKIITNLSKEENLHATSGHEISQLYGLKTRTRTAVVNGSLIPKMLETANLTQKVVKQVGIDSELMIMRADGGVMSIQEVRKRPILTMLSGLAAGVAGVLMYEKLTDGIFFEAGGTSTDISVIKDGKVMIKNAQVGGHKTYINSLDVRTIGIAGGSMIRIKNKEIIDVGPRSAHLANLEYECFASVDNYDQYEIKLVSPLKNDPSDYAVISNNDSSYAFSLCGAANVLDYVTSDDYAYAPKELNLQAWEILAKYCNSNVETVASKVIEIACKKIWTIVEDMIEDYELEPNFITLVGGGGSASVVTNPLGKMFNLKHKIAKNAPYISTIGVAMAMLREEIERSIINPTNDDIKKLRNEIFEKIIASGAKEESVEISINVDSTKNMVTAIATGASDFKVKDYEQETLSLEQQAQIVCNAFSVEQNCITKQEQCGKFAIISTSKTTKKLFGLVKNKCNQIAVINNEGVINLRKNNGLSYKDKKENITNLIDEIVDKNSTYSDAGQTIPNIYVITPTRLLDYSGLLNKEQVQSLIALDLTYVKNNDDVCVVCVKK